jgi:hypothetical protein
MPIFSRAIPLSSVAPPCTEFRVAQAAFASSKGRRSAKMRARIGITKGCFDSSAQSIQIQPVSISGS